MFVNSFFLFDIPAFIPIFSFHLSVSFFFFLQLPLSSSHLSPIFKRVAFVTGYSAAYLKQEENMDVANPYEISSKYPNSLKRLIGVPAD
jgi:hypothetical protein